MLSDQSNSDEIPVDVVSEVKPGPVESPPSDVERLAQLLDAEIAKSARYEEKLKHAMADYQNLNRKIHDDIANGINAKVNEFALDFIKVYDDFVRARDVFTTSKIDSQGLDSILKNMDSMLAKYHIEPIDAVGEIFDPNYHEAISVITDPELDENTIIKEIRKGYISHKAVIRPTLVEISKKG